MIINEVIVCTKWNENDIRHPDFDEFLTLEAGEAWEDCTGQPATNLIVTPNLYIIRARLQNTNYNTVKNSNRFFILARRSWDDSDPETLTFNNFDEQPTAQQLIAFKDAIIARFPNVDEDKLKEAGQVILRAGLTRSEIIVKLANRFRQFEKAV